MINAIIAAIVAALKAIPTLFKWKLHNERAKAKKDFEKDMDQISKDVHSGNTAGITDRLRGL